MGRWLVGAFVLGSFALAEGYAWWLTARFEPSGTHISGIAVSKLDPLWKRASPLRESDFPPEASAPGESIAEHGASLSVEADIDSDGQVESALVGVYETVAGKFGRFLLIRDGDQRSVFKFEGAPGFSALWHLEKRLAWSTCMECDALCFLTKADERYSLDCSHGP